MFWIFRGPYSRVSQTVELFLWTQLNYEKHPEVYFMQSAFQYQLPAQMQI